MNEHTKSLHGAPAISVANPNHLFIGGRWVAPSTERKIALVNPASEQIFLHVAEAMEADADNAVTAARKAFDTGPWPRMAPSERGKILRAMAEHLQSRVSDLAHAWTQQVGVPFAWAKARTAGALEYLSFCADLGGTFAWVQRHPSSFPGHQGIVVHEPTGVVATIVPWNAPLQTMIMKVAPALIAGCTVVLKPSPETPLEAYILAEAAEKAGLPDGVLNLITADRHVSEYLVRNPGVDKVSFTGSSAAGKKIGSICGERVARATLELGGKSAAIILDDYDLAQAAGDLAKTVTMLSGQVCSNLTRILVSHHSHDRFVETFARQLANVRVGNPYDANTDMGPLAMARQLKRVEDYIALGRSSGAELVIGGSRPASLNEGFYIEPTLFADVDNRSAIAQEEIFGPVVCVTPYLDVEEAVRLANDSSFGLGGAVLTHDVDRAYQVARQVRTGTVGHNGSRTDLTIGYGGFKQSGIGREGGIQGLMNYVETKTIVLAGSPSQF